MALPVLFLPDDNAVIPGIIVDETDISEMILPE